MRNCYYYTAVTLWERFGQYVETFLAETDAKRVRGVYEDAITAVGLHVAQGSRIWNAFRYAVGLLPNY